LVQNTTEIRQQVQQQLSESKATWKLAVGHHPIASFGEHCDYGMEEDCKEFTWLQQMLKVSWPADSRCHENAELTSLGDSFIGRAHDCDAVMRGINMMQMWDFGTTLAQALF
jgi:hypothetical protein